MTTHRSHAIALLALTLATPATAAAAEPPALHWIAERDVTMQVDVYGERPRQTILPRGTEVQLQQTFHGETSCLVASLLNVGRVPCAALSARPVAAERAGAEGVPAETRWITGTGVLLRDQAAANAPVSARLGLNWRVSLQAPAAGDWCAVSVETGTAGFVACHFLAAQPVDVMAFAAPLGWDAQPNPHYDPARLFWMEPGWERMEIYAAQLELRHAAIADGQERPRDPELERMKAELAKGMHVPHPGPLPDWDTLVRAARTLPEAEAEAAAELLSLLSLWGETFDPVGNRGGPTALGLVRALELPPVRPSWFKGEAHLAPPGDARMLAGRFGIVHRWQIRPRITDQTDPDYTGDGLYDMHARTQSLVRPVMQVSLFRDGRIDVTPTHARHTETLWRQSDGPMCEGYADGFSHGDADPRIWNYFNYGDADFAERLRAEPGAVAGSLYRFHVPGPLPKMLATVSRREQPLDRATTGFVRGTYLVYDLDHDAVPDLLVFEGVGRGPGHLGGETLTDDAWYRLVLANVGGRWKILGTDQFGYGCGC